MIVVLFPSANVTSHGLFVGSIVVDTNFQAAGKAATVSPALAFNINLYPPDIFSLLRTLVVETGGNVAQLDGIIALGGYTYTPSKNADGSPSAAPPSLSKLLGRSVEDLSEIDAEDRKLLELLMSPGKEAFHAPAGSQDGVLFRPTWDHQGASVEKRSIVVKRNLYTG